MPELFETHELRRFLPLPYEAAAEPRLRRAQRRLQQGEPRMGWVRLPGEGTALLRLYTLAESIRAQGHTLLVVEDGGLRGGVGGVAALLGGETGRLRFLSGLPSAGELEEALEETARGTAVLYAAGGEDSPAFRRLREAMTERHGDEAGRYVLVAGDLSSGEYGGFGLLTAAGLLPMAVAGVDVGGLLSGAMAMRERCAAASFVNPAWRYAAARRQLCRAGYVVELLGCWDARLVPLLEWAKGLFAAAEGKEGKALFPVVVDYSREFRSLGQYIQEGPRLFFETVVRLEDGEREDPLSSLRAAAVEGTMLAHTDSGVPNLILRPGGESPETLGGLIYFLQYACGLSACLLDADPLACPGVEACEARIRKLLPSERGESFRRAMAQAMGQGIL